MKNKYGTYSKIINILLIVLVILVIIISVYLSWKKKTEYFTADSEYTIEEIPNFLSQEECNRLIELSINNLSQSKLFKESDVEDISMRKSKQAWLTDQEDSMLETISERIAQRTNTNITDQESYQVVRYDKDGFYKPHYDACNLKAGDDCERMNLGRGPRYLTFLMYLNDDFEGGGTFFPELNRTVKPETGKAVIFHNVDVDGHVLPKSMHGGEKIVNGEKWIANKWIHRK